MDIQPNPTQNEVEPYEFCEATHYRFAANRREFAQSCIAGLLVAVTLKSAAAQRGGRSSPADESLAERFLIGKDGTVTVLTSKVEVGQGSRTQLTQAAAEELGLPIDRVLMLMADTDLCPDDGGTAGSRTTPSTVPRVRSAAAALRERLRQFAASKLKTQPQELQFSDGTFRSASQQLSLSELATDTELLEQLNGPPVADVSITASGDWQVLGTSVPKVAGRSVVTGEAKYPSDIQRPGMVYGKVLRPVCYGAQLKLIDLQSVSADPNVSVVQDGNFVGVTASTNWQAAQVLQSLAGSCQWERPEHLSSDQLFEHLKQTARWKDGSNPGLSKESQAALTKAQHTLERQYTVAYVQHAPMEPRAAVAEWSADGKLTVWTGTQQPARVHSELREAFRLPAEKVRVIVPDTGGAFGGKHTGEAAVEAARLSKAVQRPVTLRWTREEEFTWAYFRPAGLIEINAGLDKQGDLAVWDHINYNSGGSALESPYIVPLNNSRFVECDAPLRQGSYRALASTANMFARESAMDELAELAGSDPLEFRLRHLAPGRLKDVLERAADAFSWSQRREKGTEHRGVGLACGTEKGSFVAACAEIEISDGQIHVRDVCQAFECGAVHNPRNLRAQHAGAIIMGLGGALFEAINFANGQITNPSFSSYRVPRMSDLPQLNLVQLERPDLPSAGAGETPIIAIAPAVANALAQASGRRSRSLPLQLP